eukprot:349763-Chlamydomonas_euryale.AAC.7
MAENDEEGYAKFIKQQAEGAANAQAAERAKADPDYAAMLKVWTGCGQILAPHPAPHPKQCVALLVADSCRLWMQAAAA